MTTKTSEQRVIGSISLGERAEIRVVVTEYRGKEYLHVRLYFRAESGEWLPTKKGVSLDTELLPDLKALIETAALELEA